MADRQPVLVLISEDPRVSHRANEAMRIFGGYSYSTEYEIERYYRDAMLMCIGEGTNEVLRTVIAKQLIARNPA